MTTTISTLQNRLSERASATGPSAIRDLLDQAKRPGMVSLAGGLPDATCFPTTALAQIAADLIERQGEHVLQYGLTQGDESARASLVSLFEPGDSTDDLVVTTGSQQGLDLIARVLVDPGDSVVVGDPDYLGALQVLRSYGASLEPVAIDQHGLVTDQLEERLRWGLRPKACYLVPHFHNPTGVTLSRERRAHLNELSSRYGFVVIEDDPYRELYFDHTPPVPGGGDPELTIRLRSVSKVLTPGLRVGAMVGPTWLTDAVVVAKQSTDLHTSSLSQAIAAQALAAPWFPDHQAGLRVAYGAKAAVLVDKLRSAFGSTVDVAEPTGGMFVWARFAEVEDTAAWLHQCLDHGVCFVPGEAFAVARDLSTYARLSYATASADELRIAIDRMTAALPGIAGG